MKDYGIPEYDAGVLTASRALADYFEACIKTFDQPKAISNWIMSELLRELKNADKDIEDCPVTPENLAQLLRMVHDNTISGKIAKTVFEEMVKSGKPPQTVVQEKNLVQISDEGALGTILDEVIAANPKPAEQYRSGEDKVIGFLVGQVMKASKGKANPGLVNKMLQEKLRG